MLYFGYFLCLQLSVSALPEEKGTENMKIKYDFINGEKTEIEVEENIGTWILDSRRVEENLARKERYHCYSSDVAWEGEDYAAPDTPESLILRKYENKRLASALDELTESCILTIRFFVACKAWTITFYISGILFLTMLRF